MLRYLQCIKCIKSFSLLVPTVFWVVGVLLIYKYIDIPCDPICDPIKDPQEKICVIFSGIFFIIFATLIEDSYRKIIKKIIDRLIEIIEKIEKIKRVIYRREIELSDESEKLRTKSKELFTESELSDESEKLCTNLKELFTESELFDEIEKLRTNLKELFTEPELSDEIEKLFAKLKSSKRNLSQQNIFRKWRNKLWELLERHNKLWELLEKSWKLLKNSWKLLLMIIIPLTFWFLSAKNLFGIIKIQTKIDIPLIGIILIILIIATMILIWWAFQISRNKIMELNDEIIIELNNKIYRR